MSTQVTSEFDLLLLKREDLIEMNVPIGIRNKILAYVSSTKHSKQTITKEASGLKVMELMLNSMVKISKHKNSGKKSC
jgi:hypothetical protein